MNSLLLYAAAKTFLKAIDTTTTVQHLLFTRIKWVTLRADIDMDVLRQSRTSFNDIAATAGRGYFPIFGMNICFHSERLNNVLCAATRSCAGHRTTVNVIGQGARILPEWGASASGQLFTRC